MTHSSQVRLRALGLSLGLHAVVVLAFHPGLTDRTEGQSPSRSGTDVDLIRPKPRPPGPSQPRRRARLGLSLKDRASAADALSAAVRAGAKREQDAAAQRAAVAGEDVADLHRRLQDSVARDALERRRSAIRRRALERATRQRAQARRSHLGQRRSNARGAARRAERQTRRLRAPERGQAQDATARLAENKTASQRVGDRPKRDRGSGGSQDPRLSQGQRAGQRRVAAESGDAPRNQTMDRGRFADDTESVASARQPKNASIALRTAAGRGRAVGAGRGSVAGRRGHRAGAETGLPIWLNTTDVRYLSYFHAIYRRIQPLWHFPADLALRLEQGEALVQFVVNADGSLASVTLRKSSGYPRFDANVLRAVRSAAPFPPVPEGLSKPLPILAPFEFDNPMIR
ncbi:MAG: cell envelope integrity protein TolA [Deltaproteobacteria bacterium]|nr:cell envelope integrity protein TolA [Deltaproteobacteria bacterium]